MSDVLQKHSPHEQPPKGASGSQAESRLRRVLSFYLAAQREERAAKQRVLEKMNEFYREASSSKAG